MTRRAREIETLLLTMYAAVPLYVTYAVGWVSLVLFHLTLTAIAIRVRKGKGPEILPMRAMRWLGIACVPFYVIDVAFLSQSAIAASTHLVLFIAVYQAIESSHRNNQSQRLLTASLIFIASTATSTHVTIVPFVLVFAFLMFRQLIYLSHLETVRAAGQVYAEAPSGRSAAFYLTGSLMIGAVLFPILPRVRNPFVQGLTSNLTGASTALSDTIDFSEQRVTPPDSTVVARVWMDQEATPFFTPIRLRGMIYDRYWGEEWRQTYRGLREIRGSGGEYVVARPEGTKRQAIVQQRPQRGKLFLPVGTYAVVGLSRLYEGPAIGTYHTYDDGSLSLTVKMARDAEPLRLTRVAPVSYPITPEIAALARTIVGTELDPTRRAGLIEHYLSTNYRYIANPATLGTMSVDEFLLRSRQGHCEYFAAGMVVLLTALEVPARIAGGFYGGRLNPLTGYHTVRREDAHAWTEVWDGARWMTFDATPAALRPGSQSTGGIQQLLASLADSITFAWDRYILTFGIADQLTLAAEIVTWTREKAKMLRSGAASDARDVMNGPFGIVLALLVASGIAAVWFVRGRRSLFELLAAHLASRGVEVESSTTVEEALQRLRQIDVDAAQALEDLARLYEEERFSGRPDALRVRMIRKRLAELSGVRAGSHPI